MSEQVIDMETTIANLTMNQQGLVSENKQLRSALEATQNKAAGPMIYAKMLAVKKDIGSVGKDMKNSGQGWKFRGIDQFVNALHPILNKHGVGILPEVVQHSEPKFITNEKTGKTSKNTQVTVKYTFFAEDGSTVACTMPAEGVDPGDKGTNKALSAAFKYCLIQTFCVPTQDMAEADLGNASVDGDASASAPKISKASSSGTSKKKSFRRVSKPVAEETSSAGEL